MAHVEADAATYGEKSASFGRDYLIPRPLDQRLILEIAPAVAKAAMDSGVATRPIEDFSAYRQKLSEFVYNSAFLMKPILLKQKQILNVLHTLKVKMSAYYVLFKLQLMKI